MNIRLMLASSLTALLVACGGGGGGDSTPTQGTTPTTPVKATPLKVYPTSYENAKNLNIPAQKVPDLGKYQTVYAEVIYQGIAFGDFFQEGKASMLAGSQMIGRQDQFGTQIDPWIKGRLYFFQYDTNGNPIDKTASILKDNTGCIVARKILVVDFNGDGKPDAFVSCHGAEGPGPSSTWVGEKSRLLLSQPDGSYTNTELSAFDCYCHTATAGDLNGDGTVDILLIDPLENNYIQNHDRIPYTFALMNDGRGNFTLRRDRDVLAAGGKPLVPIEAFSKPLPATTTADAYRPLFNMELIDVDGDGKPELLFSEHQGTEINYTRVMKMGASGSFDTVVTAFQAPNPENMFWTQDYVVKNGAIYVLGTLEKAGGGSIKELVFKHDLTTGVNTIKYDSLANLPAGTNWLGSLTWIMPYNNTLVPYKSNQWSTSGYTGPIPM